MGQTRRRSTPSGWCARALALAALAACSGPKPINLTIEVKVASQPSPDVVVTADGMVRLEGVETNYSTIRKVPASFSLPAGTYTVTAMDGIEQAQVVGKVFTNGSVIIDNTNMGTSTRVTVGENSPRTVTLSYPGDAPNTRTGSGMLWFGTSGTGTDGSLVGYLDESLRTPGTRQQPLDRTIGLPTGSGSGNGAALDSAGTLYLATSGLSSPTVINPVILTYTASQLSGQGTAAPAVVTNAPKSNGAAIGGGNVWFTDTSTPRLVGYRRDQLNAGGSPTQMVIGNAASNLFNAWGAAFDASENLVVSSSQGSSSSPKPNQIVKFKADQIANGAGPASSVTITSPPGWTPEGLAFDASGGLWVADFAGARLVHFAASQLLAGGSPTPDLMLTGIADSNSESGPVSVAFDHAGALWVLTQAASPTLSAHLLRFTADQIVSTGAPVHNLDIDTGQVVDSPTLVFDPPPPDLPLAPIVTPSP